MARPSKRSGRGCKPRPARGEIDIFDWQSEVKDMLSVADLELALAAAEGYLRAEVQRGDLIPDRSLDIGTRRYLDFRKDRKAEIAQAFGLKPGRLG